MFQSNGIILLFFCAFLLTLAPITFACEMCTVSRLGRESGVNVKSKDKKWFFNYLFEVQDWHEKEGSEGHQLHHQGHHFHDKTREYLHHMTFGGHLTESVDVHLEVPYVIRTSIEVDSHAIVGSQQKSQGLGDMSLIGSVRVWHGEHDSAVKFLGGVKFPTGQTKDANSIDALFEPEMQPGTGSYDYILGGFFEQTFGKTQLGANLVYVLKTEGAQDYTFGDVISTSVLLERPVALTDHFTINIGLDTNFQYEMRPEDDGETLHDGGGTTILMGPAARIDANESVSLNASVHLPVYQDLYGAHQTLDYLWTLGADILW